jgi:hypothetical protein
MASRISEMIKANPAYKNAIRKNLIVRLLLPINAFLGSVNAKNRINTVHAVSKEITRLPTSSFLLNEVE